MSAIVDKPSARLVRPLLGVAKVRLEATLRGLGQDWIEDPSNRDARFARTGVRAELSALAAAGLTAARLVQTASSLAGARIALEDSAAALAATCCSLFPEGYARIDGPALAAAPAEISLRVLGRVLAAVGGSVHMPGREKLKRLLAWIKGGGLEAGRTLGGCRVMGAPGGILVCREDRDLPAPMAAVPGRRVLWDGRFDIEFSRPADPGAGLRLAPLGRDGWAEIAALNPGARRVPAAAGLSLPALFDGDGPVRVPHLNYRAGDGRRPAADFAGLDFHPPITISGTGFYLLN
jgi:tRNA(Ile)-lysidine synthase